MVILHPAIPRPWHVTNQSNWKVSNFLVETPLLIFHVHFQGKCSHSLTSTRETTPLAFPLYMNSSGCEGITTYLWGTFVPHFCCLDTHWKVLWGQPECLQKPRQGLGTSYWPCPSREPTSPVLHPLEPETAWETCWVLCAACGATSLCDALDCAFHHDFFFFSLFSLVYLL